MLAKREPLRVNTRFDQDQNRKRGAADRGQRGEAAGVFAYKRLKKRSPPNFLGTHAVIRTSVQQSSAAAEELIRLTRQTLIRGESCHRGDHLLVAFFPACLPVRPHCFSSWRRRVLTHLAGVRRLGNHTSQRLAAQILSKDEARRIAANVAKPASDCRSTNLNFKPH